MSFKSSKPVTWETDGNIARITLNRPESLNAFNLEMANEFLGIMREIEADNSVRVVIIKGAGKVFSAGGDIREMHGDVTEGRDRAAYFREPLSAFNEMALAVRSSSKPVMAAVHGAAAGVGFNFMLAADLIVAREGTKFTQAFIGLAVSPDGGGTWHLPRLVGYARACELTMLPTVLDAETARDWGLVNRVYPADTFEEEIEAVARTLAESPAGALGQIKRLLNRSYSRSLPEQMEAERLAQVENAAHPDFEEGLRAFLEKRKPRFE